MKFTDLLIRSVNSAEEEQIRDLIEQVNQLRHRCESLSLEDLGAGLARLAPLRLRGSSALKRGEVESWQQANEYVAARIRADEAPNLQSILDINAILLKRPAGSLRDRPVFVGTQQACPVGELKEGFLRLESEILKADLDPFRKAALAQYWLISLHPFEDANGRTAVMIADWILGLGGYLPMSFESKLDALVGVFENQRASATPGAAIIKLLKNLQRSYQAVLS
nr:hypothetical protein CKG001_12250 [Bdellovibrio sp. CKG001]BFD62496.1 hypothetical protein BdHM001_11770 [Bdellovibrio sp. HM001]BFD67602.1 hypothetical protein HAGR004_26240 [Bdellovibrio sp. HAGR004]